MLQEGIHVIDTESDEKDRLEVVGVTSDPAKEVYIEEIGRTVAEVNPEYPDDDRVILARYLTRRGEWDSEGISHKWIPGSKTYSFPESRLEKAKAE